MTLCTEHRAVARETARKSIVLLKNKDNILPISKQARKILVVGPTAAEQVAAVLDRIEAT